MVFTFVSVDVLEVRLIHRIVYILVLLIRRILFCFVSSFNLFSTELMYLGGSFRNFVLH